MGAAGLSARRLVGVDAARGVALLGMMSVHVIPAEAPDGGTSTAFLVAAGRAAPLFAVLAGVGLALATGGRTPPRGRRRGALSAGLVVRAAAIALVGLLLGSVDESGVALVLVYYAALFVLAVPLLGLRPPAAALVALAAAVAVPVVSYALRPDLSAPLRGDPDLESLADPERLLTTLLLTGYYPALAWVAYLAAGLAVGRLDLRSSRVATALLAGGAALALAARGLSALLLGPLAGRDALLETGVLPGELDRSLVEGLYGNVPTTHPWWLAVAAPHSSTPLDLLSTTGTSLAVLGAALLLARVAAPLLLPLAWAGSMTLTLYVLHVLALSAELGSAGLSPEQLWVAHVVAALLLAALWRSVAQRGPLEAGVAALSGAAVRAASPAPAPRPGASAAAR